MSCLRSIGRSAVCTFSLFVLAAAVTPARAQAPLVEFVDGQTIPTSYLRQSGVFGHEFRLLTSFSIEALGIWDEAGDGLAQAHEVGLWNADGTSLLASATLSNAATPVVTTASATVGGRWLYVPLSAPVVLPAGRFVLGATYASADSDLMRYSPMGLQPNSPDVVFVAAREEMPAGGGLTFPTKAVELAGCFGPAAFGSAVTAAPEPAAVSLLTLGIPLLAGVARRRWRTRA